mgnify:CR=1 FL=1
MKKPENNQNEIGLCRADRVMRNVVMTLMVLLVIIILYPLIYVVSSSLSSGSAVTTGRVLLWPVDPSLNGYKIVFSYRAVWTGYLNTIIYTVAGTAINMILTTLAAYPLSRRNFYGRNFFMTLFLIPMFFSGGLIPNYILMTKLHLTDTRWSIILSGAISIYNLIIMRTFFQNSIPGELLDAARIDGITDVGYLTRIVVPLSKPIFAVITLYYAVAHWNSYFDALIYLRSRDLQPLQLILRDVMNSVKVDLTQIRDAVVLAKMIGAADVMKYALIVVSTVPILFAYPFVQKFFQKGVMIGSVKG